MTEEEFNSELIKLGARIRAIRKHRRLTLMDLGVEAGMNQSDISRYEKGKENFKFFTLFRIAKALKVEINEITTYNGPLPDNTHYKKKFIKKSNKRKRPRKKY